MKQYNITWLEEEAGLQTAYPINHPMAKFIMAIQARAADKEREACAKIVEESSLPDTYSQECLPDIANEIRARGEA